jgi:divalent metal cation (Fe/Co/Zn/Cd) transporter
MKLLGWLKAVLSIVFAVGIGLAVTGITNLVHPVDSIGWALGTVLAASVLSAFVAFLVTVSRTKAPAPASAKKAGTEAGGADAGAKNGKR